MVIELSGVQFGLKSYMRTSAQREFDLKSQVHQVLTLSPRGSTATLTKL